MLENRSEVDATVEFVSSNARDLLAIEDVRVMPVSARRALKAKLGLDATDDETAGLRGFGDMETYISNFLGGSESGEPLRLKLGTPLGVGSAVLAAAERALVAEARAAADDIAAADDVSAQMDAFADEMAKDSAVQRARVGKLVARAVERCDDLVDRTLSLTNRQVLQDYVFGAADASTLPIASAFRGEVIGGSITAVAEAIEEHTTWLADNTGAQREGYADFISGLWGRDVDLTEAVEVAVVESSEDDSESGESGDEARAAASATLAATLEALGFDESAEAARLESELRDAVVGVASVAVGAGVAALAATAVLQGPMEDLLSITLGVLGIYAGVLNIPLRRATVKSKVRRRASELTDAIEAAMEREQQASVSKTVDDVREAVAPSKQAAEVEAARVAAAQAARDELDERLQGIGARIARFRL